MQTLIVIGLFALGIIIGSFLNVLSLRLKTGRSVIKGRSVCLACSAQIENKDLLPIVSYFLMGGRCRNCETPLSVQYPFIEIISGVLFALVGVFFFKDFLLSNSVFWVFIFLTLVVLSILLFIIIYDVRHKIIPDEVVYVLIAVSFLFLFIDGSFQVAIPSATRVLTAPILSIPFAALWFFSGGRWMGLGDAKLVWGFGWVLGLLGGVSAVVLGFWIGALWAIAVLLWQKIQSRKRNTLPSKGLSMKSEIPFAPFLILGFLLTFFSGWTILDIVVLTL